MNDFKKLFADVQKIRPIKRFGLVMSGVVSACVMAGATYAQEVIPDYYKNGGISPTRDYVNQNFSENIDPFNGGLSQQYVDLFLPGNGGFDLKVFRSYNSTSVNSLNPTAGYLGDAGLGWNVHFGRVLKAKNNSVCFDINAQSVLDDPVLETPDGARQILVFTGSTSPRMMTTQRWKAECTGQDITVYSPDGMQYEMTRRHDVGDGLNSIYAWYTTKITDRNGNFATIAYVGTAYPQIASVTTNDGRSITFTYANSGTYTRRLTSISGAGQTYTYGYTAIPNTTSSHFLTSVTRPDGNTWGYTYNNNLNALPGGYLMNQVKYPQNGTISYQYGFVYFDTTANPNSRSTAVTGKTQSVGGSWTFAYTPGTVNTYDTTVVTDPSGTTTYRHIGPNYSSSGTVWMVGLLASKTIGSLQTETYTWGKQKISPQNNARPGAFLLKVDMAEVNAPVLTQKAITRNAASYTTTYSNFNTYGAPGTITESGPNGGSRTTTATYFVNPTKWVLNYPQNESFLGSSTTRAYDTNGNLTNQTIDGVSTSHTYDTQGNRTSTTFPRGLVHNYSNYHRGIPRTETQPESISITRTVSDAGNITSEKNGEGYTTSYGYDGMNRRTSLTPPTGSAITTAYTATTETSTRSGLTRTTTFNGLGYIVGISEGGISTSYSVDALGRRTFVSNPGASVGTSYQFDQLNRTTRVTNADSTFQTHSYGASTKTVVDERGKSYTSAYRSYGNPNQQFLMSITAPVASSSATYARNSKNMITSATQGGVTRTYGYSGNYYLTSAINPETGTTTYGRDAAGNMTSRKVGASGTTTYTYDGQNRLTTTTYPAPTPAVTNTYNKVHKLLTRNSSIANRSYTYDANRNMTSETLVVDGHTLTAGYAYNNRDQLISTTYPRSGTVVNYAPDVLGRPTQASSYLTSIQYWPSNQVSQITYANGIITNYGQNNRLWASSFRTQRSGANLINTSYGFDGVGNLTSVSDTVDADYARTNGFDDVNRLTSSSGPWGTGSVVYGNTGNITSQTFGSSVLNYAYDTNNRLSSVSGSRTASFLYDSYGNITTGTGTTTYAYDDAPSLRCVNCADTNYKIEYGYDGNNMRVFVDKANPPSPSSTPLITDNTDTASIERSNGWPFATSQPGYEGTNYQSHIPATNSTDYFTWKVNVPVAGTYKVFAKWTTHANRATDAPYSIVHSNGTALVQVNQQNDNGTWVQLGTYNFNTGEANVTLRPTASGYVIADAIQFIGEPTAVGGKTYEMHDRSGNLLIEYTPADSNRLIEYVYLNGKRVAQKVSP